MSENKYTCPVCEEELTISCDIDKHPNDMYGYIGCEHVNVKNHSSEEKAEKALIEVLGEYTEWKTAAEQALRARVADLEAAIKEAVADYDNIDWGWAGDMGTAVIMGKLEDLIAPETEAANDNQN